MRNQDHDVLRGLATRWMELASLPVMAVRRRQWTALKDLRAELAELFDQMPAPV